ncbi:uncharacterized protein LOC112348404 [Selaginella moellendorffii]|uniref:uncharacterized protein LOC112348404 n=1 Tax=Selaginella moellendorffii TaxID=88036 RepID=UPI000D1C580E|nr:uncharacterized protein LOC112348404 [Selaginella moellendorffii]|eukprot:XP_024536570.1 uncharacterized protein LOC112348404 [Selaginella moellendorffii]
MRRASAQALYSNRTARALHNLPSRRRSSRLNRQAFVIALVALFVLCSIGLVICWSFVFPDDATRISGSKSGPRVSRIAFGSSSSHDYSAQPAWVHGIIPSDPHAWIWLGNMAYLDEARVNCDASPNHYQCNCSADWLRQPPHFCMTGDLEHAASKMQIQLANPDYAQFLAFMCPGHREKGLFPPPGADPAVCPKRIFGTYSDHDYGWRHGNKRLPQKDALKQVFLDALGESLDSPRRNGGRGIEWKYTLNQESKGYEIDVILLDTRYYRDPLPCHTKRAFCKDITRTKTSPEHRAWCEDFLGGETGMGSCCGKDSLFLNESELPKLLSNSNFCDVLGNHQRNWLETTLLQSNSPVKLIVSSSSVLAADDEVRLESRWNVRPGKARIGLSACNLLCVKLADDLADPFVPPVLAEAYNVIVKLTERMLYGNMLSITVLTERSVSAELVLWLGEGSVPGVDPGNGNAGGNEQAGLRVVLDDYSVSNEANRVVQS